MEDPEAGIGERLETNIGLETNTGEEPGIRMWRNLKRNLGNYKSQSREDPGFGRGESKDKA